MIKNGTKALSSDLDDLKESDKESNFILDVKDLDTVTDDVIDEIKKQRAGHSKMILDMRKEDQVVNEINDQVHMDMGSEHEVNIA